jgi:ADP-ribosylglycohydrolase
MSRDEIQRTLDILGEGSREYEITLSRERFEGALLFSAIGDALGWPTEFLTSPKPGLEFPLREFVKWRKYVGGYWWGYVDEIERGEYSDDTQLTLAIARCINDRGEFEPEQFAYYELPLWLQYERGGGRSIKAAARSLIRGKTDWTRNFYKLENVDYRFAGANGAAMRNLPIALVRANDERRLVKDTIRNAIITHGHPRAILGAVLFGLAVRHALSAEAGRPEKMLAYLDSALRASWTVMISERQIVQWASEWEKSGRVRRGTFYSLYRNAIKEATLYLSKITPYTNRSPREYYSLIGALDPATKSSGVATVCAAIYHYLRDNEHSEDALTSAVNMLGSDTDTISYFLGAMLGAQHGRRQVPSALERELQDHDYLSRTAVQLQMIASGRVSDITAKDLPVKRREAFLNILAWEIGLHEMFWDAIDKGGVVVHPTLGRGEIIGKKTAPVRREGHIAKLLQVRFECGQTCVFHSRVKNDGKLSESLTDEVSTALRTVRSD